MESILWILICHITFVTEKDISCWIYHLEHMITNWATRKNEQDLEMDPEN